MLLYVACDRWREKKRERKKKKRGKERRKKEEKTNYFAIFYDLFLLAAPAAGCMGGEP
jgi:CRISPR/Cas system CMR subunit Cmr4 (Cas7 group RAMP superfamily)